MFLGGLVVRIQAFLPWVGPALVVELRFHKSLKVTISHMGIYTGSTSINEKYTHISDIKPDNKLY